MVRSPPRGGFDDAAIKPDPRDYDRHSLPAERFWLKDGGRAVIRPDASHLLESVYRDRSTVFATIDPGEANRSLYLDVHGHYACRDIFDLRVDTPGSMAFSSSRTVSAKRQKRALAG